MKYWKIYKSDVELCLKKLNIPFDYIESITCYGSDLIKHLEKFGCAFILYNSKEKRWGWVEEEEWVKNKGYNNCGEVRLRKDKLKKLNDKFR